ncbi:MAG: 8-amino-7-oxononanoate synthase, partial [Gammaproteobacteria bacterium]|nr:8-amino-7-oxononanoate synthase [Gammaproteobacteria bacterium]
GAAHLVTGHSRPHHALEEELADFTGRPRALLFSTGYMANLGTVTSLLGPGDAIFEDRLNHASLLDAGLMSRARLSRYAHGDAQALASKLETSQGKRKLVVTDGVFSMDGDAAPLPELAKVARSHDAWLMVDDAHGLGILGEQGGGCLEYHQMGIDEVAVLMGTLGKGLGSFGAFVAGSEELIETLIQQARSYIYTTALPPAVAEASRASLALIREEPWRREHLNTLIRQFREGAKALNLKLMDSLTPIQPLLVGEAATAVKMSEALHAKGLMISAIRPPTVAEGASRLRITLSAAHSEAQVECLLTALAEVAADFPQCWEPAE